MQLICTLLAGQTGREGIFMPVKWELYMHRSAFEDN